MARVRFRSFC